MNGQLSAESQEFYDAVSDTLGSAGGVALARRARQDPHRRAEFIEPILEPLGVWEIEPLADGEQLEAAAAACEAAGSFALPYPIAERLARPEGADGLLLLPDRGRLVAEHADLPFDWAGTSIEGVQHAIRTVGQGLATPLGAFVGEVVLGAPKEHATRHAALVSTLKLWWLVGLVKSALADTVTYTAEREQFGRPIAKFQSVQFRLTEMAVASQSFAEMAKYALWSVGRGDRRGRWLVDSLALRVSGLEGAEVVLRGAHQLHGAMGFADETDVSVYSVLSQAVRRLPLGLSQTESLLAHHMLADGYDGVFSLPAGQPDTQQAVAV